MTVRILLDVLPISVKVLIFRNGRSVKIEEGPVKRLRGFMRRLDLRLRTISA